MKLQVKELKRILKPLVRECINEVLAEQYLKTLAESSRQAAPRASVIGDDERPRSVAEVMDRAAPPPSVPKRQAPDRVDKESLRARLREHAIATDSDMAKLYEDSLETTVPAQENGMDVSEAMMQKVGVYDRDYSKYNL